MIVDGKRKAQEGKYIPGGCRSQSKCLLTDLHFAVFNLLAEALLQPWRRTVPNTSSLIFLFFFFVSPT